jgi:hypothetical protein
MQEYVENTPLVFLPFTCYHAGFYGYHEIRDLPFFALRMLKH